MSMGTGGSFGGPEAFAFLGRAHLLEVTFASLSEVHKENTNQTNS